MRVFQSIIMMMVADSSQTRTQESLGSTLAPSLVADSPFHDLQTLLHFEQAKTLAEDDSEVSCSFRLLRFSLWL